MGLGSWHSSGALLISLLLVHALKHQGLQGYTIGKARGLKIWRRVRVPDCNMGCLWEACLSSEASTSQENAAAKL